MPAPIIPINMKSANHMDHSQHDCALLVPSCDAYSDLWQPFFTLLNQHWADLPFPIFIGADQHRYASPHVTTLSSSGGVDWSQCVIDYLQQIPCRHVLIMLDDFFLRSKVSTPTVLECLSFAKNHDAIQVRLVPLPKPSLRISDQGLIGECEVGMPYRLSTQAAIWQKNALLELLKPRESIWQFEHKGNERANERYPRGFYASRRTILPYLGLLSHHVVEKGLWLPHEKWLFSRQDIGCDFQRRATLPTRRVLVYHLAQCISRSMNILPWRWKKNVIRIIKHILSPLLKRQFSQIRGDTMNPSNVTDSMIESTDHEQKTLDAHREIDHP